MHHFGFDRPSFAFRTYGFGSSAFSPMTLFTGGKQGAWYDPSDLSTLFQDAAGTIPVTANGDPVGMIKDKSGNGKHATQTISASRPTYQTDGILHWLKLDGADDYLEFNLPALTQPYGFAIGLNENTTGKATAAYIGSTFASIIRYAETYFIIPQSASQQIPSAVPHAVYHAVINAPNSKLYINSREINFVSTSTAALDELVTYIGLPSNKNMAQTANAKIYGIIINKDADINSQNKTRQYLAYKTGVTL